MSQAELLKAWNQLEHAEFALFRSRPGGGYSLRLPTKELTALDVLLAVDTIPGNPECPLGIAGPKPLCPLRWILNEAI